jgi:hypothetical protein
MSAEETTWEWAVRYDDDEVVVEESEQDARESVEHALAMQSLKGPSIFDGAELVMRRRVTVIDDWQPAGGGR